MQSRGARSAHEVMFDNLDITERHTFVEMKEPEQRTASSVATNEHAPSSVDASAPGSSTVVHNGVLCDFCDQTITGTRHKCLDCRGE